MYPLLIYKPIQSVYNTSSRRRLPYNRIFKILSAHKHKILQLNFIRNQIGRYPKVTLTLMSSHYKDTTAKHKQKASITLCVTEAVHLLQVIVCLKKTLRPHREGPTEWEGFLKTDNDAYLFRAVATSTAQATVHPTIGLLPIPRNPIISTWAGTEDEPANCASLCIRPIVSVIP